MKIGIVDDDEKQRIIMKQMIMNWAEKEEYSLTCDIYADGKDFLQAKKKYDAVFLDIYMEHMGGIETAGKIREKDLDCLIIFMTISEDHRADAFSVHAFDYLEKPIREESLIKVMKDMMNRLPEKQPYMHIDIGKTDMDILYTDIKYIVSDANYCVIHAGENYRVRCVFKDMERKLERDKRFLKINRGILVNLDFVKKMEDRVCELKTGDIFPMNSRNLESLNHQFVAYQFERRMKRETRRE